MKTETVEMENLEKNTDSNGKKSKVHQLVLLILLISAVLLTIVLVTITSVLGTESIAVNNQSELSALYTTGNAMTSEHGLSTDDVTGSHETGIHYHTTVRHITAAKEEDTTSNTVFSESYSTATELVSTSSNTHSPTHAHLLTTQHMYDTTLRDKKFTINSRSSMNSDEIASTGVYTASVVPENYSSVTESQSTLQDQNLTTVSSSSVTMITVDQIASTGHIPTLEGTTYDPIDYNQCYWSGAIWGVFSECANGYVGVGACASGKYYDCDDVYVTKIHCCRILSTSGNNISNTVTDDGYAHGWYGENTTCSSNQIINKLCGSGSAADCHSYYHYVMCSSVQGDRSLGSICYWLWGTWGEEVTCPNQMVINGLCSSGMYKDCNNDYSHGIYCCDVV